MALACAAMAADSKAIEVSKVPLVAIMQLTGNGVDEATSASVTEALSDELMKTGRVRVMERSQMEKILKEQGFQQSGACDGSGCAVEVGKLLSINRMVVGTLGKLGSAWTFSVRGVDVQTGEILGSARRQQKGEIEDVVPVVMPGLADELVAGILGQKVAPRKLTVPTAAPVEARVVETPNQLRDPRDGKTYAKVKIGSQVWMAQNLNYPTGNSWCYDNKDENCQKYGRLYDWEAAKKACPSGWHLPSDEEWTALEMPLDDDLIGNNVGGKLKAVSWNGTDAVGFHALPGGGRRTDGNFNNAGSLAYFWSSSEFGAQRAWCRNLIAGDESLGRNNNVNTIGFSIRCLKD
jgi:uncharacterized protein (TIGR02145 family)